MSIDLNIAGLSIYILVFCRVAGMIFFNPLLSRKAIPTQFKAALVLGLTLLIAPLVGDEIPVVMTDLHFIILMFLELGVGFACGFLFQIFYFLIFTAGDVIDLGFGLSMAKTFDPATNIQSSLSGNILEILFVLYIFVTNCHLVFIRIIFSSYNVLSIGGASFGVNISAFFFDLFAAVFVMIIQLSLPFIVATFVVEIAIGLLMKLVPQINVFVVHFQFKVLSGFLLMFLFAGATSNFMLNYINQLFISMGEMLTVL